MNSQKLGVQAPQNLNSLNRQLQCKSVKIYRAQPPQNLGCARFPEFVQKFSKRQILWSLHSVVFHALTCFNIVIAYSNYSNSVASSFCEFT